MPCGLKWRILCHYTSQKTKLCAKLCIEFISLFQFQASLQRFKALQPSTKNVDTNVITFETELKENIDWPLDKEIGDEVKNVSLDEKSHTSWSEFGGHSPDSFQSHNEDDKNKDGGSLDDLNDPNRSHLSKVGMVVIDSTHNENVKELATENSSTEANRADDTNVPKDEVS